MQINLVVAQQRFNIKVKTDSTKAFVPEIDSATAYDSLQVVNIYNALRDTLYAQGFLQAEGKLLFKKDTATIKLSPNRQFLFKTVLLENEDSLLLSPLFQDIERKQDFLSFSTLKRYQNEYLKVLENNGYPFSQTQLANWRVDEDTLKADLLIETGPFITIDSVVVKGYTRFSSNVLKYFLEYKKGMPYSEAYINNLPNLIGRVEYLGFNSPPALAFSLEKTTLYLYVQEIKSNQIDGIVGLNTKEDGTTTINGEFQLRLLNTLKTGEEIKLKWRRPDESVQSLDALLSFPFVFKTPFWIAADLNIFRQDSSFVNTKADGFVKYYLGGGSLLNAGLGYKASNALQSASLGFNSFNTVLYKLGLEWFNTDRILIPRKGYNLKLIGFTANRQTQENSTQQYGWEVQIEHYLQFFNKHVVLTGLNSSSLFAPTLFTNEVYRIGGLKSLRGFNEQQLFTSSYAIGTLEYRYMIGTYDYLTVFSDVAFAENTANETYVSNVYTGLGTGFSFRTNVGIFSLFYALGRDLDNGFDFRTSKIHFGYISQF